METAAPASRTDELLAHLRDIAIRVIELLLEWDEDNNGAVDQAEFLKALPVLGMPTKRAEGKVLFKMLSGGAREVDHWVLFRKLVSAPGVDLEAAEANARTQLAIAKTKDRTAVASPFWQRETGGKAVNRHALRKRNIALQPWQRQHKGASGEFAGGLRSLSPTRGDGDVEEVNARQLQGVVLTTTASIEQQLLAALDQHLARVIGRCSRDCINTPSCGSESGSCISWRCPDNLPRFLILLVALQNCFAHGMTTATVASTRRSLDGVSSCSVSRQRMRTWMNCSTRLMIAATD